MQSLASPGATSSSSGEGLLTSSGGNGFLNDLFDSGGNIGMYNYSGAAVGFGASSIMGGVSLQAAQNASAASAAGSAAAAAAPAGLGAGLGGALAGTVAPAAGSAAVGGAPVLAGVGQASTVGGMSVPASWSAATPETTATTVSTAEWTADVDQGGGMNVATGMPAVASAGRGGYGFGAPRYGVKPKVMPKPKVV
jgi:hypothetical protein